MMHPAAALPLLHRELLRVRNGHYNCAIEGLPVSAAAADDDDDADGGGCITNRVGGTVAAVKSLLQIRRRGQ